MTRKKEQRVFKIACLSVIMAILVFSFIGCAGLQDMPTETKVVVTYESMGAVLNTALLSLKSLCDTGIVNAGDCAEAKKAYNEAVAIYKFLGDMAIVAVDTGDNSSYGLMAARLMKLLTQIQAYGASQEGPYLIN